MTQRKPQLLSEELPSIHPNSNPVCFLDGFITQSGQSRASCVSPHHAAMDVKDSLSLPKQIKNKLNFKQ